MDLNLVISQDVVVEETIRKYIALFLESWDIELLSASSFLMLILDIKNIIC